MKKVFLVCGLLIGISAASFAQGGGGMKPPAEQAKSMQTALKLTDDQTSKITTILTTQAASRDSAVKANNGDRKEAMKAFRPMMKANNERIMAILTPEQKTAWEKIMADRRAQQGGQGGGTPPPPPQR